MSIVQKYAISGDDFSRAGEASSAIKNKLKQMGFSPEVIRNVSIAAYEGEINAVIHANGGEITVTVEPEAISIVISDTGGGIPDIGLAMQEGYTTASDNIRALGFGAGMGLPNMKKYADEFDIQSEVGKGTVITMKIYAKR
ncbi:MAG: anti-sigma regulatory factor [Oscillospiraceae bacterium]|jgi:anti-sigma regulatory factor (Ser/Thr protein kinase)|nr:anti-sigma regulatory factor [Oscillospiraceae bacterium]